MRLLASAVLLVAAVRLPAQPPPEPPTPVLPIPTRTIISGLIDVLGDPDLDVRMNAAVALANVGVEAVEPLTSALKSTNPAARAAAAYSLGQIGGPAAPATAALVRSLKDEDKDVRRLVAEALGRIVAGSKPQPAERPPLAPPVPITAPPPSPFPAVR
jgi:HEAT repeat protein